MSLVTSGCRLVNSTCAELLVLTDFACKLQLPSLIIKKTFLTINLWWNKLATGQMLW